MEKTTMKQETLSNQTNTKHPCPSVFIRGQQKKDIDSGKSIISYKPYGEIDRKNSSGPDIFRYKYTAQESDSETGLHYFKARYYDPKIGHFTQADPFLDGESVMGLNQYMYTYGSPVNYNDPSGNIIGLVIMSAIINTFITIEVLEQIGMIEEPKISMDELIITFAVAMTVFTATVFIGGFIASGIVYPIVASAPFGPALYTWVPVTFINAIGTLGLSVALSFYPGRLIINLGREIGRFIGSFHGTSLTRFSFDYNSEHALEGAELGKEVAEITQPIAQLSTQLFSPWHPDTAHTLNKYHPSHPDWQAVEDPSFHMFDCSSCPILYGPRDNKWVLFTLGAVAQGYLLNKSLERLYEQGAYGGPYD